MATSTRPGTAAIPERLRAAGGFYGAVPSFNGFARVLDPTLYAPLPEGWVLGLSDVVGSTAAIAQGRYKAVNMAGAATIASVTNALAGADRPTRFPFVFGGDGAAFAVPAESERLAADALAATACWAEDELGLAMRAAIVPMVAVRGAGQDVRVARFSASPDVDYAMFTGGGLAWAEREMKAGRFAIPEAEVGARPDLAGLTCRWEAVPSARGVTLSVILVPAGEPGPAYADLVARLVALTELGRPVGDERLHHVWPPSGTRLELTTCPAGVPRAVWRLRVLAASLLAYVVLRFKLTPGGFDAESYRREVVANADFRKYDDGLRMTIDCTPAEADALEAMLVEAERDGVAQTGTHRQDAALMTCFVPSLQSSDHVHFIDGAAGGYAAAATHLKGKLAKSAPEPQTPCGSLQPAAIL